MEKLLSIEAISQNGGSGEPHHLACLSSLIIPRYLAGVNRARSLPRTEIHLSQPTLTAARSSSMIKERRRSRDKGPGCFVHT